MDKNVVFFFSLIPTPGLEKPCDVSCLTTGGRAAAGFTAQNQSQSHT